MHGQVVHAVTAHVLAGGCDNCDAITWMTWLLNSIWGTMSLGVKVGAGAFLLIVLLVRRTLKAVVLALLVCGIAFWGVIGGGIGTAGDMVGKLMPHGANQIIAPASPAPPASPTP